MAVVKNADSAATPASARFNWGDLRIFLMVAEQESFSAAAKSLGISQPTVTQRVQALEDRLRSRLFVRGPNGVVLTDAGRSILEDARTMERAALAVERRIRESDDKEVGRVRLAAPDGLSGFWIAPRLVDFYQLYPNISLSMDAGLWPDHPVRDELDISVQYHDDAHEDFVVRPAATIHFMGYASRSYVERFGEPKNPRDFLSHEHRFIEHSAARHQPETWEDRADAVRRLVDFWMDTNCSATLLMACQAGAGIATLPTCATAFMPDLVPLGETPVASPKLYFAYHKNLGRVARVRRVLEWLTDVFEPDTNPWFRSDFVHPREFLLREQRYGTIYGPVTKPAP